MLANIFEDKEVIFNRELGLVEFNQRVLAQATNSDVPLLEQLRYLCIVSKNCDELFEVRVARLLKWSKTKPNKVLADGLTVAEALEQIRVKVDSLYQELYHIYNDVLIPKLAAEQINILSVKEWDRDLQKWAYNYFIHYLKPVLTPIGIDSSKPFPRVPNKSLHFAVELDGKDQFGRMSHMAIVEAPRILNRVIELPREFGINQFVLLQDIIKLHVNEFFYGMTVKGCYPFRVTRGADLEVKSDKKNLRVALKDELNKVGLSINKFYYVSDYFKNINYDKINIDKMKIILEHLTGFHIKGDHFVPIKQDFYDEIYFYDDEFQNIDSVNNIQYYFEEYIKKQFAIYKKEGE